MKKHLLLVASLLVTGLLYAQATDTSQAFLDSIDAKFKLMHLKEISVTAPKPVYSMTGEVVHYNVENDPTVEGLTAWDAIRHAPTVSIDAEGNITMRGSEQVEVWLNGQPTHMSGQLLQSFFEAMPADALARVEVIKNPSAKYMVAEGHHILNIVTSARLRTSQLLVLGLSGSNRPYLSPWMSYVRNTDRLRFNIHVNGGSSRYSNRANGGTALLDGSDTTSRTAYSSTSAGNIYMGTLMWNVDYKIDSATTFSLNSLTMMRGAYGERSGSQVEQWDELPLQAHYRYLDTSDSRSLMGNGFTTFQLKRSLARKGQTLSFSGTWNYLFSGNHTLKQRLIQFSDLPSTAWLLAPYDRTTDGGRRRNTLDLSARYTHPIGERDELTFSVGGQPYGNSHLDRTIMYFDSTMSRYSLADTLRNGTSDYSTRNLYALASLRHEWSRTTLTVDVRATLAHLHIANSGLFPDDTICHFLNLEPSLSITHRTPSMHYLRMRYTLLRTNPTGGQLTTSRSYADDSYSLGSRSVHSALTHRGTLSWNKYHSTLGNVSLDAYANYTSGGIESITLSGSDVDPYLGRIVSYEMPMNIVDSYRYGVDANLTFRPAAWISLRMDGSLYRQGYRAYADQAPAWATANFARRGRPAWSISGGLWVKIAKIVNTDLNLTYGSPTLSLFTEQRNAFTASVGASATLLDGRLSLRLNVNDLFDSNRLQHSTATPSYASYSSHHSSLRYITFGLTYRIGKLALQWQARGTAAVQ